MNSSAWLVSSGRERYVLKIAPAAQEAGLEAAAWLDERGFATGAPARMALRADRVVALLRFVEGRDLGKSDDDVQSAGEALGRAHSLLVDAPIPHGLDRWPWVWLDPAAIAEPDLRAAAVEAIGTAEALAPSLTHGILHGDPNEFIATNEGVALIDWGAAVYGPLLYDVASAWLYTDEHIVSAYARTGPLEIDELAHTADFLAFRQAVQAWYFSDRIHRNDLTGFDSQADNATGLAHARRALLG
jgi:homoserine kinase type II